MPTVAIYFVQAALESLRDCPDKRDQLLVKNRIPPSLLDAVDARIPDTDFAHLLRDIMLETEDELVGLGAGPQPLGSWATMSQLCISAGTLGEALKRLARFYRFMNWGVVTQCQVGDSQTAFIMASEHQARFSPYVFESFLFYVHRFANWLIDRQIPVISVDFCFSPPPQRREYQRLFFTNQFKFDQTDSKLVFANDYLKEPIRQDDQSLKKFLEHSNLALITQSYRQQNWQSKVQKVLVKDLSDNPSIKEVSETLNVHPHTLRTYLRKDGVKFKDVKDHLRLELAIEMLLHQKISVEKIAENLGYSETGAFTRAFKRWTGIPPLHYRHMHDKP